MADVLRLKRSNCKNCYKCIRYCPVKSIRFSAGQANIVPEECILCGQCFVVCPQDAKEIADDREKVEVLLGEEAPVIASIAPSFIANWEGSGIEAMKEALKKLGFTDAEETAIGATIVKREYERILREEQPELLITSCCHSVNLLIQKHFPGALPYLAKVISPMQAHALDIKRRIPNAKVVFIGPCVSKKDEAIQYPGTADVVLTFGELEQMLAEKGIEVEKKVDNNPQSKTRLFPISGGVLRTMEQVSDYTYMVIDGVDNCIAALKDIVAGNLSKCFIEMSSCAGSCSNGPVMEKYKNAPVRSHASVIRYAGTEDFQVDDLDAGTKRKHYDILLRKDNMPSEKQIREILIQMGKVKEEQELNCGTCGYPTCREKAIATYQGKAELSMCLPFLKDKAESFSKSIIDNTPNGIVAVNENLEVQQINKAACKMLNISTSSNVLGEQVVRIMDPKPFMDVLRTGMSIRAKNTYLAEYRKYVEQSVIYDPEYKSLLCIMRDVTDEQNERERKDAICRETAEVADKVIEKQMRIVQEIASLLGETAAETKIALTKLKESIQDE